MTAVEWELGAGLQHPECCALRRPTPHHEARKMQDHLASSDSVRSEFRRSFCNCCTSDALFPNFGYEAHTGNRLDKVDVARLMHDSFLTLIFFFRHSEHLNWFRISRALPDAGRAFLEMFRNGDGVLARLSRRQSTMGLILLTQFKDT